MIILNNIVNKGTKGFEYPNNFQIKNTMISDMKQMVLMTFFLYVGLGLAKEIVTNGHPPKTKTLNVAKSMFMRGVDEPRQ